MAWQKYRPEKKTVAAAVLLVAATYGYFLIFAQFGFLKTVLLVAGEDGGIIKPIMMAMGLTGVAGSVWAARTHRVDRSRRRLAAGFAVCAVAAGLSRLAESVGWLYFVAILVGSGTGFATVTLACILRRAVGDLHLGTIIGLGTGLAYGFCNLPAVFEAGAEAQAGIAMLMAGAGIAGAGLLTLAARPVEPGGFDYSNAGRGVWTLVFLALVALDSAAFYIIQHTPELKGQGWSGSGRLEMNAGMHVLAAVLAGYALDRRWLGRTVAAGALGLLAAGWLIDGSATAFDGGALLYTAGVSIYSTALVFYPAYGLRPGLPALVYGVAGWGGSALGVGLAEGRQALPEGFIVIAGGVIVSALFARRIFCRREADTDI